MKFKKMILTIAFGSFPFFSYTQQPVLTESGKEKLDSLQRVEQTAQDQKRVRDQQRIDSAKSATAQAKLQEDEAKRIQRQASTATAESKRALKAEQRAQKARHDADEQARKAAAARERSDQNMR